MNVDESTDLIGLLSVSYPRFDVYKDPQKLKMSVMLWAEMFKDISFGIVQGAVMKYILESPYPPTIHDIRSRCTDIQCPELTANTAMESWFKVHHAVRLFGSYRESEALASLDELTKNVVQAIGYQTICMSEDLEIVRAHFLKHFDIMQKRGKERALSHNLTQNLVDKYSMPKMIGE